MGRKNSNARKVIMPKKLKVQPDVQIEWRQVRYKPHNDIRPGVVVAEGRVMTG